MNRRDFLATTGLGLPAALSLPAWAAESGRRPNIVLLFADDAGYADFGFQGSTLMKTPRLDALAAESVRFSQAYVTASVCGPSRAGLMTGRYPQRFGYEENNVPGTMSPAGLTGEEMGLPLDQVTLADRLKPLGYRSIALGKWHLGGADRYHPLKRGFDEFLGFRGGARSYWPYKQDSGDPLQQLERDFGGFEKHEGYLTDVLADEACRFVAKNREQPFFVYLAFNAVHTPLQATKDDLAEYPDTPGGPRRRLAGMTTALDRACGKVLDQLDSLGLSGNTLVVFTNDNGGPTGVSTQSNEPLAGVKGTQLEGGIRVPFLLRWPERVKGGQTFDRPISTLDLMPTFVEAAGGDPAALEGVDGVSLLPYVSGDRTGRPHETLYWKKETRAAIRDGDWKLLRLPDRPAVLFNIAEDPEERHDLASAQPERVEALYKKLWEWELTLDRPRWQLDRRWEGVSMRWFDRYKHH